MKTLIILAAQQGQQSMWQSMIMLLLIVVVFYFFMIRPQAKKQKEQQKFREALKKGDKVITAGGIYGKLVEVSATTVVIECEGQVRLKVDKTAIHRDPADIEPKN